MLWEMKMWKYSRWQHRQNVMFPGTCFCGLTLVCLCLPLTTGGSRVMWWHGWLRHCATSRKVVGSIPDGVIGIFD